MIKINLGQSIGVALLRKRLFRFLVTTMFILFSNPTFANTLSLDCIQSGSAYATKSCVEAVSAIGLWERLLGGYESDSPEGVAAKRVAALNLRDGPLGYSYTIKEVEQPPYILDPVVSMRYKAIFYFSQYRYGSYIGDGQDVAIIGVICPTGWKMKPSLTTRYYPGYCEQAIIKSPSKNNGPNGSGSCGNGDRPFTQHPINIGTGNKYLFQAHYTRVDTSGLQIEHSYNSVGNLSNLSMGGIWQHYYDRRVLFDSAGYVTIARPDGRSYLFQPNGAGGYQPYHNDLRDILLELKDAGGVRTGWTYTVEATGEVETYDANGRLLSIADRAGRTQSMTYSCTLVSASCPVPTPTNIAPVAGLLIQVTDNVGRSLHFTYDSTFRIPSMTNPAGGVYTYAYDTNNNLSSVTYPDNKVKTYLYGSTAGESVNVSSTPEAGVVYTNSLTGIIDENNNRYATYSYDSKGRATSEYLAGNADAASLLFNVDANGNPTTTQVTDSRGAIRTYNFTTILGVVKSTGQSQPAGAGCAASAAALTYDVNGNIASRTDFKGNKTTYAYDMARNLEISRTEGLTTANAVTTATRTITTSYHPNWRLPLVITEYNGATSNLSNGSGAPTGTALRTTTTAYDAKGNITSITEADPVRSTSRTTSMTYIYSTAVSGLVLTKVVDGPRTDVNDISTYNYYPHDATCTPSTATPIIDPITNTSPANLGCRGQLQSMSNALNQTTTYDRYNHHGQIEQMTDANGLVSSSTYDLRQRLLTRTTGTETTTLTYDNVGQVTQLTLPDASQLSYTYDAAHRLTDVQDSLGNKVHYTLDTEGNRTNETTTDPTNVLTKTLSRSYDALNRLQQVTGVE